MNKNKIVLIIIVFSFMMFAIIFGASYSYFAAQGVGSGDDRQVTTTVGELKLTYSDGSEYLKTTGDWEPGDYLIKTFTVKNDSSSTAYYRLYMDDVVNTFVMQKKDENGNTISNAPYELIYTLKKNDTVVITEVSNTPVLNDAGIIYGSEGLGIEIAADATDTYELTIKFIDTEENQNYNQAKMFSATINLKMKTMYEKFTAMMKTREDMALDDYDNIRFVGKGANNYITFNGEEWRVIGIFKDIEVANGYDSIAKQNLIKIVRNESIGSLSWDTKGQYGENDWTNATLMNLLNGDYLNGGEIYTQSSTIRSLSNVSDYIADARWNIGGYNTSSVTPKKIYLDERGNMGAGKNLSTTTWYGKVALMYPSDYGYSANGEVILNDDTGEKTSCLNTTMNIWHNNGCKDTTWLLMDTNRWLLTSWTNNSFNVFYINYIGAINNDFRANAIRMIHPALYLKPDIKLTGTGEPGANAFRIVE